MDDVARPPGLVRRNNVFYCRVRIPADVLGAYGERREFKESLRTSDPKIALQRYYEVAARYQDDFNRVRRGPTAAVPKLDIPSPERVEELIRSYVRAATVRQRDELIQEDWQSDPDARTDFLAETAARLSGLEAGGGDTNSLTDVYSLGASILGNKLLDRLAASDRWPGTFEMLRRASIEVERQARRQIRNDFRSDGPYDALFRAAPQRLETSAPGLALSEACRRYVADLPKGGRGDKRDEKIASAHVLMQRFFGCERDLRSIDRNACREFRDLLPDLPSNLRKHFPDQKIDLRVVLAETRRRSLPALAFATQEVYFQEFVRLLRWAVNEGVVEKNPCDGIRLTGAGTDPREAREPFGIDDLTKIFNQPLYRGCADDQRGYAKPGPNVIRGTRFWIPLVSLFSGMRLNEICQLDTADIKTVRDIDVIHVNADGEDKKVKTRQSKRVVPIHPVLKQFGFMAFVADARANNREKLFGDLTLSGRGYFSERMSRWFNEGFLSAAGVTKPKVSFHSFRHSFRDALRSIEAPAGIVSALGGWEAGGGVSDNYGSGYQPGQLSEYLDRLSYPGLDLSHLILSSPGG